MTILKHHKSPRDFFFVTQARTLSRKSSLVSGLEHHRTPEFDAKMAQMSNSELTRDELWVITRYLYVASFMSAWHKLNGNKKLSNQGSFAASGLAVSAGYSLVLAMELMLSWEETIQTLMVEKGIATPRALVIGGVLWLVGIVVIGTILWFWMH
ncbi:MAG: hypothetical protein NT013_22375 [Planctomycetia bacterium]|nr:hypothetical protein [Planctomycetia bacterium]